MEEKEKIMIEKNIPIPQGKGHKLKYPQLKRMEVGDSILLPEKIPNATHHALAAFGKKNYAVRTVEGGCRVWRIK